MNTATVYYASAYERRAIKTIYAFLITNFVIIQAISFGILSAAALGLMHGCFLGMVMSYLVYGINCTKRKRRIVNGIASLLFIFLSLANWYFEMYLVILCSLLIVVPMQISLHYTKGKCSGDYMAFSDKDFDCSWFDFIDAGIADYPVFFPIDIRHNKWDQLSGIITSVGMGIYDKYQGIPVAKIQTEKSLYLCPIDKLVPHPLVKSSGAAVIASKQGDTSCEVILCWYEYGGYTKVVFNNHDE